MFSIQELINQSLKREEHKKESWWPTDLGKCLSGAYYRRLGAKPDKEFTDRQLRIFKCGNLFEDFIAEQVKKSGNGYKIETQARIKLPEYDLTGYADLRISGENTDLVYEIKSVHSRKFWYMEKREGPDEHYMLQLWIALYALKVKEGRLIYVSKDDLTIAEYPVYLNDERLKSMALGELAILNEAWSKKEPPPPEPAIKDGKINWKARWCDYHSQCLGDPDWLLKVSEKVKSFTKKCQ
jgi:hypothetical protein